MKNQIKSSIDLIFTLELETIKELATELEGNLTTKLSNWEHFAEQATMSYTEEEKEEFYEAHMDDGHKYLEEQPQLIRRSLFVQSFFLFEHFLNQLCDYYKWSNKYNVSYRDMDKQGINRAKLYLSKICLIQHPFDSDIWRKIQDYRKVRNSIAHSNNVMVNDVSLVGFEKSMEHNNKYTFTLEKDFVDNFIKVINDFISKF